MNARADFSIDDFECEQQTLAELTELLLVESAQWIADLRSAAADRDIERVRTLLNAIKGAMSIFGLDAVCRAASTIERLVDAHHDRPLMSEITKLNSVCRQALSELRTSSCDAWQFAEPDDAVLQLQR